MTVEPILQIEDLTKHFPGFCLDHLSLSLPKGTIMGLIGENGAGKTTVINLILHAVEKDGGEIRVFGRDHLRCEKEIKQMIGIVQDQCNLPAMFSIRDVEQVMRRIYTGWDSTRYRALAEQFRLPSERPLSAFSRGMKAKLSFAIALAHGARLLILDEATSNLDPVMRDDILDLLLDFMQNEENGVLFSSHITGDLAKIADNIAFLHQGKLLLCKPKDELIYRWGLLHCGERLFRQIAPGDMLAWCRQDYEYQVLVADRDAVSGKYGSCVMDPASLDDIMRLYIRGERA